VHEEPRGVSTICLRMLTAGVLTTAVLVLIVAGRAMAATKVPEVGYLSASHVSTTGATIEVPINPEGGETIWEIWLECQNAERNNECEPLTVGLQRQQAFFPLALNRRL